VDLASATDELYAGSPDDFIERRKALVARARAVKDRPLATAIGGLRRPTRSAWLVNLYAREAADQLGSLLELGEALRTAQQALSGPELRRLSTDRQRAIAAATRQAAALGEGHGYTSTEAVRQEVTQTLQAALADPRVADQVRAGRVVEAQAYGGFGPFGLAPVSQPSAEGEPERQEPEQPERPEQPEDDEPDAAERHRAEAEERLAEAEAALSTAAEEADQATERADGLADRVETLRAELAETERAEADARKRARAARKRVGELEVQVRAAREVLDGT
jgi:hypothetical protein